MSNAFFLMDDVCQGGSITASSSVATLPITNALTAPRFEIWRSTSNADAVIDITLPAATFLITDIAIVDSNLSAAGSIRVQGYSDTHGGTLVDDITINPWAGFDALGVGNYGVGGFGGPVNNYQNIHPRPVFIIPLTTGSGDRFWRVTLSDTTLAYHQLARIVIAQRYTPALNFSNGRVTEFDEPSGQSPVSITGLDYTNTRPVGIKTVLNYPLNDAADAAMFNLYYRLFGRITPFIAQIDPANNGLNKMLSTLYCRFDGITQTRVLAGITQTTIPIREVL